MAGIFRLGEEKVRPGTYFRITTNDKLEAEIINGITAVIFRSDFGPLGQVTELSKDEDYADVFGAGGTTDAVREAFNGGALTVLAFRLGSGGNCSEITLQDKDGETCVTLGTKYPGARPFSVTIREKITDDTLKECVIYSGTKEIEKVTFVAGEGEAASLAAAIAGTESFVAKTAEGKEQAEIANVCRKVLHQVRIRQ